jgi:hypothetical protein
MWTDRPSSTATTRRVQLPVQQRARLDDQDERDQRRRGQERHQVVAHRQRQDEDHQQDQVVILALAQMVAPAERQPRQQRDREQRNRVDLLVHVRLVPHRERGRADQHGRTRADQAEDAVRRIERQDAVGEQEPAAVRARAHGGAEQVDAHGVGQAERLSSRSHARASTTNSGFPGGCGMPMMWPSRCTRSCPRTPWSARA